ncbi:choice-of-anchor J domain-containing protein [Prevotella falsenii]|uniref:choice-of-anchor J domain-containing protein n=1 Tax=Prevotella falsenii TaxID=515414 RepID=UPI000468F3F1|nr:choice-of-anchor J domain-containing protein [Prevotella falsenii]
MKTNLFKNTYAAIAALFIAMLALPQQAQAQEEKYQLWIAGVQVTSDNCNDLSVISGVNGTVKYDPSSNVLTLQNATINAGGKFSIDSNIEGLKINVVGTNNVQSLADHMPAFRFFKSVYITGGGVLNLKSQNTAIFPFKADLTIENCTVNASAAYGINGRDATEKVTIKNAKVTAIGKGSVGAQGAILNIGQLNLIGCKITQPAEAVFDPAKHAVVLNGETVTDKIVIEPTGGGGDDLLLYENFDGTTAAIEGRPDYYQLPSNWSTIDADGDGNNWIEYGKNQGYGGTGKCAISESYINYVGAFTPDNYLITPKVAGATRVTFYACAQDKNYAKEHFAVCASTTGKNESDFKVVQEWTISEIAGAPGIQPMDQSPWKFFDVALPAGTQYVAFRHFNSTDQFSINIDEVKVYNDPTAVEHITADVPAAAKKGIYTLSGVRLQGELKNLPKGIYIVNGQKVVKQ